MTTTTENKPASMLDIRALAAQARPQYEALEARRREDDAPRAEQLWREAECAQRELFTIVFHDALGISLPIHDEETVTVTCIRGELIGGVDPNQFHVSVRTLWKATDPPILFEGYYIDAAPGMEICVAYPQCPDCDEYPWSVPLTSLGHLDAILEDRTARNPRLVGCSCICGHAGADPSD